MFGGNGILLENHVIRHLLDIESIHPYEGAQSIQTVLIGRDVTGQGASPKDRHHHNPTSR